MYFKQLFFAMLLAVLFTGNRQGKFPGFIFDKEICTCQFSHQINKLAGFNMRNIIRFAQ